MRFIIPFFLSILIGGCSSGSKFLHFPGIYKVDIQQGNQITQEMIDRLRPNMTKAQVKFLLGSPILHNILEPNRWDYVYSLKKPAHDREQKTVSLFFENDKLIRISGDIAPTQGEIDN